MHFWKLLTTQRNQEAITDEFFALWEYLNDVMRQSNPILSASVGFHLYTHFWQPVLCPTLCSYKQGITQLTTVRITEMVRSLKDRTLQHLFMVFLLGEYGGGPLDLLPEALPAVSSKVIHDDDNDSYESRDSSKLTIEPNITLRQLLIARFDDSDESVSISLFFLWKIAVIYLVSRTN
jgi:hypothetical protein